LRADAPRDFDDEEDFGSVTAASSSYDHIRQGDLFRLILRECPSIDSIF
jgi:hypothetical protein